MADIAVARCFVYQGADGVPYEFACGCIYTGMSDEFADHWYTQWHTEAAVRARGGELIAYRQLLMLDAPGGTYQPIGLWAAVMLSPSVNPQYDQNLRIGDKPLFHEDIEAFTDLERPERDLPVMPAASFGFGNYRRWSVAQGGRGYHVPTRRVFPGDGISPPVGRVTDPDNHRVEREEREHFRQQVGIAAVQTATVRRFVDPRQPSGAPITRPPPLNPFDTTADAREARRIAA